jgi:hypothetical protein
VREQLGLDEGEHGDHLGELVQPEKNTPVRHHRVRVRPGLADRGLGETELQVEVEGGLDIVRRQRILEEAAERADQLTPPTQMYFSSV